MKEVFEKLVSFIRLQLGWIVIWFEWLYELMEKLIF